MSKEKEKSEKGNMNRDEQVGFHKGSLATLAKEREEMIKILQIVEQLMQMHLKSLKDLGVDLVKQAQDQTKKETKGEKLDDLLKKKAAS